MPTGRGQLTLVEVHPRFIVVIIGENLLSQNWFGGPETQLIFFFGLLIKHIVHV